MSQQMNALWERYGRLSLDEVLHLLVIESRGLRRAMRRGETGGGTRAIAAPGLRRADVRQQ